MARHCTARTGVAVKDFSLGESLFAATGADNSAGGGRPRRQTYRRQSSSASRRIAGAAGFLTLSQDSRAAGTVVRAEPLYDR
jgi:hypothetical protein